MPAQPLSADQKADAARLKAIYESKKRELGLTQESLASACGWESQGTVSQYLNGKIPLNLEAAIKFSEKLKCSVLDFSPRLAETLSLSSNIQTSRTQAEFTEKFSYALPSRPFSAMSFLGSALAHGLPGSENKNEEEPDISPLVAAALRVDASPNVSPQTKAAITALLNALSINPPS